MESLTAQKRRDEYYRHLAELKNQHGFLKGAGRLLDFNLEPSKHPPIERDPRKAQRTVWSIVLEYFQESFLYIRGEIENGQKKQEQQRQQK